MEQTTYYSNPHLSKKITLLLFLITFTFFLSNQLLGQLPPSIHRVAPFDTEIDGPYSADGLSQFLSTSFTESFGTCWNTAGKSLFLRGGKSFSSRPLTLHAFINFTLSDRYNIICASDPKSSPAHWELFLTPQDGKLGFFLPGNSVDTFLSEKTLADGE